jgi:hypothetical protein
MELLLGFVLFIFIIAICFSFGKAVEHAVLNLTTNEQRSELHIYVEEDYEGHSRRRKPNTRCLYRQK